MTIDDDNRVILHDGEGSDYINASYITVSVLEYTCTHTHTYTDTHTQTHTHALIYMSKTVECNRFISIIVHHDR